MCDSCLLEAERIEAERAVQKYAPVELMCQECGGPFLAKRKHRLYCDGCHQLRRYRNKMNRMRQIRDDTLTLVQERYGIRAADWAGLRINDYMEEGVMLRDSHVPDRQPRHTYTARGSSDGMTTTYEDLQNDLDSRARLAAQHEWWDTHRGVFETL